MLFEAHRAEILRQSLLTFRQVMRDETFGELYVDGSRPQQWRHVFASIQTLNANPLPAPDRFDMVIVDEFHHAEAATYQRLLSAVRPKVLLGLTATPERTDGQDIKHWFGGRIAAELRLWEALERGLLAPFQYFGIHDRTDLRQVGWRRGQGYDTGSFPTSTPATTAASRSCWRRCGARSATSEGCGPSASASASTMPVSWPTASPRQGCPR